MGNKGQFQKGHKRAGPGRPKGMPNKVTADVMALAQVYTPMAMATLAHIAERGQSEQARVAASNSLLDRGHGRPKQALEHSGDADNPVVHAVTWLPPTDR